MLSIGGLPFFLADPLIAPGSICFGLVRFSICFMAFASCEALECAVEQRVEALLECDLLLKEVDWDGRRAECHRR